VAVIEVSSSDGETLRARLAGDSEWCVAPCRWVVPPGSATVEIDDAVAIRTRVVALRPGAVLALEIAASAPHEGGAAALAASPEPTADRGREGRGDGGGSGGAEAHWLSFVGLGATVLGAAVGTGALIAVSDLHDRFERDGRTCSGSVCEDGLLFNVMTNVGWGLALVGGLLVSIDLIFVDHSPPGRHASRRSAWRRWVSGAFEF
jgi:hypothetical protein